MSLLSAAQLAVTQMQHVMQVSPGIREHVPEKCGLCALHAAITAETAAKPEVKKTSSKKKR